MATHPQRCHVVRRTKGTGAGSDANGAAEFLAPAVGGGTLQPLFATKRERGTLQPLFATKRETMNSPVSPTPNEGLATEKKKDGAAPARILLVDDDPVNQMVALGLLRRRGWEAIAAGNGKEALEILTRQSVNLILMDLQMPEMDGFQTATAI